jgi:hypothetical protein
MRAFAITASFQEEFGYPALTAEAKLKIFGLNAAELYGVEPNKRWWGFSPDDIRELRQNFPDGNNTLGPTTLAEVKRFHEYHQGWA